MFTAFRCSTGDCTAEADRETPVKTGSSFCYMFFWGVKCGSNKTGEITEKKNKGKIRTANLNWMSMDVRCHPLRITESNLADFRMVAPLQHY